MFCLSIFLYSYIKGAASKFDKRSVFHSQGGSYRTTKIEINEKLLFSIWLDYNRRLFISRIFNVKYGYG